MKLSVLIIMLCLIITACQEETDLLLETGDSVLHIDEQIGGRVSSLTYKNTEFLSTTRDTNHFRWGSTVWYAPQKLWNWPPPKWIDQEPYRIISQTKNRIILESGRSQEDGLQLKKSYSIAGLDSFTMVYYLINHSQDTVELAIWENTRVEYIGRVQFEEERGRWELGPEFVAVPGPAYILFEKHRGADKDFTNSEGGYLVYEKYGFFFRKDFEKLKPKQCAPGQSPIEIYYDPENAFAELEVQGAYQSIPPGDHISMKVLWTLGQVQN